jgi:hypothetical protein
MTKASRDEINDAVNFMFTSDPHHLGSRFEGVDSGGVGGKLMHKYFKLQGLSQITDGFMKLLTLPTTRSLSFILPTPSLSNSLCSVFGVIISIPLLSTTPYFLKVMTPNLFFTKEIVNSSIIDGLDWLFENNLAVNDLLGYKYLIHI